MILCDERLPLPAKSRLAELDVVIEFATRGMVYDAISGHPDIFSCPVGEQLVVSPALPPEIFDRLEGYSVHRVTGKSNPSSTYPGSAAYNAVVTPTLLIHHLKATDPVILELAGNRKLIQVNQGYTRCNLLPLPDGAFITSDLGIQKVLAGKGLEVLWMDPAGILLKGFAHGFIGGACGVMGDTVLVAGSLSFHPQGELMREFLLRHQLSLLELYEGPLVDGGSLLVV